MAQNAKCQWRASEGGCYQLLRIDSDLDLAGSRLRNVEISVAPIKLNMESEVEQYLADRWWPSFCFSDNGRLLLWGD